jgi:hypothetical protein
MGRGRQWEEKGNGECGRQDNSDNRTIPIPKSKLASLSAFSIFVVGNLAKFVTIV